MKQKSSRKNGNFEGKKMILVYMYTCRTFCKDYNHEFIHRGSTENLSKIPKPKREVNVGWLHCIEFTKFHTTRFLEFAPLFP